MARIGGQVIPRKMLLLIGSESFIVTLSLVLATTLRFLPTGGAMEYLRDPMTLGKFLLVGFVFALSFYYHDLYDLQLVRSRWVMLVQLLQAVGVASLIFGVLYFADERLRLGRGIALLTIPTVVCLIVGWRLVLDRVGVALQPMERLLVVGTGPMGVSLANEIANRPELNCHLVGFLSEPAVQVNHEIKDQVVGGIEDLEELAARENVDRVILSLKERRGAMPIRELLHLKFRGIQIDDPHTFFERITGRIVIDHISPSWFILSRGFNKSRWTLTAKRFFDITASALGLAICWPLMLLTALAIILEDGFPALFKQERIGLNGKKFRMLKFRSMRKAPAGAPPSWTADGDKRITRVGAFIRKSRLDELPQLINVLRGDMSVVGPRPEQPYFCELLEQQLPFFAQRHTVRPGITGWAQVKYQYGASVEDSKRKLELDLFYIKYLSVLLDWAIMFETAKVMLIGRGAK